MMIKTPTFDGNSDDIKKGEDRSVALRSLATEGGVMLNDGAMWDGIERRTSRLLTGKKGKASRTANGDGETPSLFFG